MLRPAFAKDYQLARHHGRAPEHRLARAPRALLALTLAVLAFLSSGEFTQGTRALHPSVAAADESCLDPADPLGENGGRKGIQRRPFLKRLRVELSAWGGFFAADLLSTTYTYGGAVAFYPFEDWGFEVSLHVSPFDLAIEKPLTNFFAGQVYEKSLAFIVVGNAIWSPIHFKVKATEKAIGYGDVFFYLGAGDTIHDTVQGLTFDVGFGVKFYAGKYFGVRFDLRDYLMVQEAIAVQRVTNNLVGTFGISVYFPNPRPYSK